MAVKDLLDNYEHHFVFVITLNDYVLQRFGSYTFSELRILLPTAPALLLEPTQSGGVPPPPLQTRTVSSRGIWRRTGTRHL